MEFFHSFNILKSFTILFQSEACCVSLCILVANGKNLCWTNYQV